MGGVGTNQGGFWYKSGFFGSKRVFFFTKRGCLVSFFVQNGGGLVHRGDFFLVRTKGGFSSPEGGGVNHFWGVFRVGAFFTPKGGFLSPFGGLFSPMGIVPPHLPRFLLVLGGEFGIFHQR